MRTTHTLFSRATHVSLVSPIYHHCARLDGHDLRKLGDKQQDRSMYWRARRVMRVPGYSVPGAPRSARGPGRAYVDRLDDLILATAAIDR